LANRASIKPPDALKDSFISELRLDVKREVEVQCPLSLIPMVSLARLYKDKLLLPSKHHMAQKHIDTNPTTHYQFNSKD